MPPYDEYPEYPKSSDIELHPDNAAMYDRLRTNIRRVLNTDFIETVEITDTRPAKPYFALPQQEYLARVAFMRLGGEAHADTIEGSAPEFQLAITAKGHGLNAESATAGADVSQDTEYVWPEGIELTLLDRRYNNRSSSQFLYQEASAEFEATTYRSGYSSTDAPQGDIVRKALHTDDGENTSAGIHPNGLEPLEELRVIDGILTGGRLDFEAHEELRRTADTSDDIEVVTRDFRVIRGSQPYFSRLIQATLDSPRLRDAIAWQQYWDEHRNSSGV